MLKFLVFDQGKPAQHWPLRNSYLVGADGNALRGDVAFLQGAIVCEKREAGPAAFVLQHKVGELGELTLQTCLLPERDEPYLLSLELARHRLMTMYNKLEDWGMFDVDPDHPVARRNDLARRLFVEALCAQDDPARVDKLAFESLVASLDGSEELALAHSELLLNRRKSTGALPRHPLGCGLSLDHDRYLQRMGLLGRFDFLQVAVPWKQVAPEEGDYRWQHLDNWVQVAQNHQRPLVGGPLVAFEPTNLPDWLYIWEHDYDTVRDLVYEHIERVVSRYKTTVHMWNVVSGLHVNSHFSFNFEQLMDLTRMACMLVKKVAPQAKTLIEIREPFGEYFAWNPRSIPPMMYADLVVQSAIVFDGFALRLPMGQARPGQFTRDLMQVSNLLDQFAVLGKPVHLTVSVPSEPVTELMLATPDGKTPVDPNSGCWRQPWSQVVQAHWLQAVCQIAMSKPYIESVAWQELLDHPDIELPLSGLMDENLQPKGALKRMLTVCKTLHEEPAGAGDGEPVEIGVVDDVPPVGKDPDVEPDAESAPA